MGPVTLPPPPRPVGAYEPVVVRRGIGFVSGQFPIENGSLRFRGRVGHALSLEDAREACRIAALNALSQISAATDGFSTLEGLLRLDGYIASSDDFFDQPTVLDVASELFLAALGPGGAHARTAFAVPHLPLNAPVELCVSFATV